MELLERFEFGEKSIEGTHVVCGNGSIGCCGVLRVRRRVDIENSRYGHAQEHVVDSSAGQSIGSIRRQSGYFCL